MKGKRRGGGGGVGEKKKKSRKDEESISLGHLYKKGSVFHSFLILSQELDSASHTLKSQLISPSVHLNNAPSVESVFFDLLVHVHRSLHASPSQ